MFFQNKEKLFFHCHLEWSYFSNHEKTHRQQKRNSRKLSLFRVRLCQSD